MDDDACRTVGDEDGFDDGFKEGDVGLVVDAVSEGDIETVMFALACTYFIVVPCSREKVFWVVFVEGKCEYTVGGKEGFLDTVAMVQVDVNV